MTGERLECDQLLTFAASLAGDHAGWAPHVRHDPAQRTYRRLVALPHVTAYLICWMPGHDTGFHDHDGAAGAVTVVRGVVAEERLCLGGPPAVRIARAGDAFAFGGADIHRVRHAGTEPAVTIHVYSPMLRRMGAYVAGADGVLLRHALDEDVELRAS